MLRMFPLVAVAVTVAVVVGATLTHAAAAAPSTSAVPSSPPPAPLRAPRPAQLFAPDGLYVTAQYVHWLRTSINDSLYQVDMYYDFDSDRSFAGQLKPWSPPFVVWWYSGYWKSYLEPSSALGTAGPLGHTGPLGSDGPIGKDSWDPDFNPFDPSTWTAAYWAWFKSIAGWAFDDPSVSLGPDGPLGKAGPVTTDQMYNSMYHLNAVYGANDFGINLDIFGVWGMLGPLGPLGPLSVLGALGPFGPHLLNITTNGEYRNNITGAIQRNLRTVFDNSTTIPRPVYRIYDLFEVYPAKFAQSLGEANDCSWMAEGSIGGLDDSSQVFRFTSSRNQTVNALVLPIGDVFHDIDLYLTKRSSTGGVQVPILASTLVADFDQRTGYLDAAVWRARAGDVFELRVMSKRAPLSKPLPYRVVVTGSGFRQGTYANELDVDFFAHFNIVGPHQANYCTEQPRACH